MSIYFLGGSFDPPHLGHLKIIQSCFKKFDVNKFILIPTNRSPFKKKMPIATAFHRIQMLKLLINNINKDIIIDDWEVKRDAPSYSYDTIKHLNIIYPNSHLSMIIGEDQLECFKEWKNYNKILDAVELIVFNRSENNHELIKDMEFRLISDFQIDISSTFIREDLSNGKLSQNDLIPEIYHYIQENELYDSNVI